VYQIKLTENTCDDTEITFQRSPLPAERKYLDENGGDPNAGLIRGDRYQWEGTPIIFSGGNSNMGRNSILYPQGYNSNFDDNGELTSKTTMRTAWVRVSVTGRKDRAECCKKIYWLK
jgi:hypothetical protein